MTLLVFILFSICCCLGRERNERHVSDEVREIEIHFGDESGGEDKMSQINFFINLINFN